mgnify:CR=1 FL=1
MSSGSEREGAPARPEDGQATHTFAELVEKQQLVDRAYARVEKLRRQYGPPTAETRTEQQAETYETALRAWRDLEREAHAAITEYARDTGLARHEVEERVRAEAD